MGVSGYHCRDCRVQGLGFGVSGVFRVCVGGDVCLHVNLSVYTCQSILIHKGTCRQGKQNKHAVAKDTGP